MARREGYDALFGRIQSSFDIEDLSEQAIYDWLTFGKKGGKIKNGKNTDGVQRYTNSHGISSTGLSNIQRLSSEIAKSKTIYDNINETDNLSDLDTLKGQSRGVVVYQSTIDSSIAAKEEVLYAEEERNIKVNESVREYNEALERIESLSIERQKELFRQGKKEERILATEALRDKHPKILGGLKSGENRRIKSSLKRIF